MKDFSPTIIRVLRKYYGISQVRLAKTLGVGQGTISKIESGRLELSAHQWVTLCTLYKIDPTAIVTGRVEALENLAIDPYQNLMPLDFKMPERYKRLMGSTVRTVFPFLEFVRVKFGSEKLSSLLEKLDVDPDYFVVQNLPINIKIIEDIFEILSSSGKLTVKNVPELLNNVPASEVHCYALESISKRTSPKNRMKAFIKSIPKLYEVNTCYDFQGEKKCFISTFDNIHLRELNLSNDFKRFRQLYGLSSFQSLAPLLNLDYKFKTVRKRKGWDLAVC